jgi:putative addiction module component (TIGR02574 family)
MPAAAVSRNDKVEPVEGRIMNDEIAALVAAAARLPAAQRLELIEAIADTLADEACEPLSPVWEAEIARRSAKLDAGIGTTVPWETVRAEALARLHRGDQKAGLSPVELDEFLTGERTLRSDTLDRLAAVIGYQVPPARADA